VQRRTLFVSTIAAAVFPELAIAETAQRLARIGWVTAQQASSLTVEAFRSGLADLGYIEGRNLVLVLRYGDDKLERVPELAAELVRVPVDVIDSQGATDVLINKLDLPVPVVYAFSGDPVSAGFAESLARPHAVSDFAARRRNVVCSRHESPKSGGLAQATGRMFWFKWKKLLGSYFALSSWRRR
jgi:putative ABC transport system substrate-binding protein